MKTRRTYSLTRWRRSGLNRSNGLVRRDEQQAGVFDLAFGAPVHGQPRIVEGMADVVVEFLVLLGRDLVPRPGPQGRGLVERLGLVTLAIDDRQRDMVAVFLDDPAQPALLQELALVGLQVQHDAGAARNVGGFADGEVAPAVRFPAPAMAFAGLAGQHHDLVRHHEGGIEADAELADQADILLGVAGQLVHEGGGAGARDGA